MAEIKPCGAIAGTETQPPTQNPSDVPARQISAQRPMPASTRGAGRRTSTIVLPAPCVGAKKRATGGRAVLSAIRGDCDDFRLPER